MSNPQLGDSSVPPPPGGQKERMVAGLLAIFLGALGIHKFYLGGKQQKNAGIVMLLVSVIGWCLFLAGPTVMGVFGFIEGIIYLTKDDDRFQDEYGVGDKAWF